MMIYYQLLTGEQYEKTDDYELAESFFTAAYQEAKKHLPAKHHKYYLLKQQNQRTFFDPIDRLAYFYLTIGNLKRAAQLFQESKVPRDDSFPSTAFTEFIRLWVWARIISKRINTTKRMLNLAWRNK